MPVSLLIVVVDCHELGAALIEVRQDPPSMDNPDTWTVLHDPEGNEFCVSSTATLTGWA